MLGKQYLHSKNIFILLEFYQYDDKELSNFKQYLEFYCSKYLKTLCYYEFKTALLQKKKNIVKLKHLLIFIFYTIEASI